MGIFRSILFDLDGTLIDPGEGITNSAMYALKHFGINVTDRRELYSFIGPPITASFMEFYGFSAEDAAAAVRYYREYYRDRGIFECTLYPGIEALLQSLRSAGLQVFLATSKPEPFALRILQHFAIDRYFTGIAGALMDETRSKKGEVIRYALQHFDIRPQGAIMVGDRHFDVLGAAENGIGTIGALYGYGSREELKQAGAVSLAENAEELKRLLLGDAGCRLKKSL